MSLAFLRRGFGAQSPLFVWPAEDSAKAGKMSTFVSAISPVESRRYAEFMPTFVYRVEKSRLAKSKSWPKTCLLLSTFHVWAGRVLFGINGLSATDA
jgi:hypothetical protein